MEQELMSLHGMVKLITGPIEPLGCASRDPERLENLKARIDLANNLLNDIRSLAKYKDRHEHSVNEIGECATIFLNEINE